MGQGRALNWENPHFQGQNFISILLNIIERKAICTSNSSFMDLGLLILEKNSRILNQ